MKISVGNHQKQPANFFIDKVSEDSFFQNFLFGLNRILEENPCVYNICLRRTKGLKDVEVKFWEHSNGLFLPEDMKNFYGSTDGFYYSYYFSNEPTPEGLASARRGGIFVNGLEDLKRVFGYETSNEAKIESSLSLNLKLSPESKVFELTTVEGAGKVVLVYLNPFEPPTIWLYNGPSTFHYLADTFTIYLRMAIAHLGIPGWQLEFTPEGIPNHTKDMYLIMAPGVLLEERSSIPINNSVLNKIDERVFTEFEYFLEESEAVSKLNSGKKKKPKKMIP